MARLKGKSALITGAAEGIGFAMAQAFAREGARVILSDYNKEALDEAEKVLAGNDFHVTKFYADVRDHEQIRELMKNIASEFSSLDILVNNAGGNVRGDFRHMGEDQVSEVLETNLNGTIRCSREAFELLKSSGNASIINLSSILASRHMRQVSVYSATKGAVESLTRAMALEFAAYKIRVNFLAPGFITTKLTERFTKHPYISKALLDQTPLKRFGKPEEIANAAVFLASEDANFITGTGLTIDGGVSLGIV